MKYIITAFILSHTFASFGQSPEKEVLLKEATAIEQEITALKEEIKVLENKVQKRTAALADKREEIHKLENKALLSNRSGSTIPAIIALDGNIRSKPDALSKIEKEVTVKDTVEIVDYEMSGYWLVRRGDTKGYIHEVYIDETPTVKAFRDELVRQQEELVRTKVAEAKRKTEAEEEAKRVAIAKEQERQRIAKQKQREQQQQKIAARQKSLIAKYGNEIGKNIMEGRYWIGRNDE